MNGISSCWLCTVKESLIEVYDRLPASILDVTEPLITILKMLFLFPSELKLRGFKVCIPGEDPENPLTILFIGKKHCMDFFRNFLGTENWTIADHEVLSAWEINDYVEKRRAGIDAVVVNINKLLFRLLDRDKYLRMPDRVRFVLAFQGSRAEVQKAFHKNIFSRLQSIRAKEYTYTLSHDAAEFAHFYSCMYMRYIKERFGSLAVIEDRPKVERLFRTGFLLMVRNSEEAYISGAVCRVRKKGFVIELVGVENGSLALLKEGALDALYYFAILAALERNCTHIDFGNCRPFLNDGLVRYKRKWGALVMRNPKQVRGLGLTFYKSSDGSLRFLKQYYPYILGKKGLYGIISCEGAKSLTAKKFRHFEKAYFTPGMHSLLVISSHNGEHHPVAGDGDCNGHSEKIKVIHIPERIEGNFLRI